MRTSALLLSSFAILTFICPALSQGDPASEALKLAQTQCDAYVAAFNKADVDAVAKMYREDTVYTNEHGGTAKGRAEVQAGLKKFFTKNKGAKLELALESARMLTPDVLIERGLATLSVPEKDSDTTRYTATQVKTADGWQIAQLDEAELPPHDAGLRALAQLGWMVGSWKDNSDKIDVQTNVSWAKNQHFLRRSFVVTREGEEPIEGTEIIGYDPAGGQIHSWIFDSEGGFGEGSWSLEGNKWLITCFSTLPDGSQSTAQHIITMVDNSKYTWESVNREVGGEALPNLDKIEVVRTAISSE
jgi:uncharacterized protein (TIGR02246 family)